MMPKEIGMLYGLLPGFDANCKEVYALLRDKSASNPNRHCWPSQYTIALETGQSTATVKRKIATLVRYELIARGRRIDSEGNLYTVYEPLGYESFKQRFPEAVELYVERERKLLDQRRSDKREGSVAQIDPRT